MTREDEEQLFRPMEASFRLRGLKDAVNAPMQIDCALSASVLGKALCESGIGAAAIAKQLKLVCGLEGQ